VRYREVYKLVIDYYLDLDTHQTYSVADALTERRSALRNARRLTSDQILLFRNSGSMFGVSNWKVVTSFLGFDAREMYPQTNLKAIDLPLVFETERMGVKTFWSDYEQAKLGHETIKHTFFTEDGHESPYNRLETVLSNAGMPSFWSLLKSFTIRCSELPPRIYTPITMPASGYPSDIEQYITL